MCGIIGMFAFNDGSTKKEYKKRLDAMLFLFTEILQNTRKRGTDATGVSALFSNGNSVIQKGNVPSPEFIANFGDADNEYGGFIETCKQEDQLNVLLGHCRKSSIGNTWDNENNHPIKAGEIVGIHNGTLKNHEIVFSKLKCERDGDVDSEVIMRLLQTFTNDCKDPFTIDTLEEVTRRLEGAFSVIAYNANNPYQVALIRKTRPMEMAIIKPLKLMVVYSEDEFLDNALYNYNKAAKIYGLPFDSLSEDDIDTLTMPLDNIGVVNLTTEIKKDTKVIDVLIKKDTFKTTKFWQTPVSKTYTNNWNKNKSTSGVKETVKKSSASEKGAKEDKKFPGKVFCKELNTYVKIDEADKLTNVGPVLLDNPKGNTFGLEKLNNLKEIDKTTKATNDIEAKIGTSEAKKEVSANTEVIEIQNTEDPEILKGVKSGASYLERYDSVEDLVKDLDATSIETVNALPSPALANRVRVRIYEKAFIEGADFYKKLKLNNNAEKAVRIAKHIVTIFGTVISRLTKENIQKCEEEIQIGITQVSTNELTKENINNVFSKGNLLRNQPLNILEEVIK